MNYLDALAGLLREHGVPEERVRGTTDDLAAFLAEGDLDPEEEFGPVDRFADELVGEEGPEPEPESLVWAADSFVATDRLNEKGAEGWEIDRVDRLGRFVGHRAEDPQSWEYRQEIAPGRRERARLADRIAPEGWEPCGHYFTFAYFKRARAAVVGPAAELGEERREPGPRRYFWSLRGLVLMGVSLVVLTMALYSLAGTLWEGDAADRVSTLAGAVVGGLLSVGVVLGLFWVVARLRAR
ncbi:DUF2812 domain-containing protein [Nocardiopsis sp. MG754419]|uniref:DUF2812 domain-containing protein n=1 Tax=Nocardiopsis sp. MG754419 TaxID=2259865 RepID=UPI001BA7F4DC|nr:DUF2812 domain-containing protein [Nocardiopsis sp. MG754419]MBR8741290.1 DUF2812 domain-containing protein [Nocardiopsis sp. MG754419]